MPAVLAKRQFLNRKKEKPWPISNPLAQLAFARGNEWTFGSWGVFTLHTLGPSSLSTACAGSLREQLPEIGNCMHSIWSKTRSEKSRGVRASRHVLPASRIFFVRHSGYSPMRSTTRTSLRICIWKADERPSLLNFRAADADSAFNQEAYREDAFWCPVTAKLIRVLVEGIECELLAS